MRHGRGARVPADDPLAASPALVIAAADDQGAEARVMLAASLDPGWLTQLAEQQGSWSTLVQWDGAAGRVRTERQLQLGALVVGREPWPDPPDELVQAALLDGIRQQGLGALPWSDSSRQLQRRLVLAHGHRGSPWPNRDEAWLLAELHQWLPPHLQGCRSLEDLQQLDLEQALWGELAWDRRHQLEQLLPLRLPIPSGRLAPLLYNDDGAVLAVKLQELFGWSQAPRLLDGTLPVTLHLLSPGGRPLAITRDLDGFWRGAYGEVRREMRGRYPRHPWPEHPATAVATALTNRQLRAGSRPAEGGSR